eukprot:SAG25_NODE_197_length_12126_cov_39.030515_8_plen_85_part_00
MLPRPPPAPALVGGDGGVDSGASTAAVAAAAAGEAAEREAALAAVTEKRAQLLEGVAEVPADVQAKTELMAKIDAWLVEVGIGE